MNDNDLHSPMEKSATTALSSIQTAATDLTKWAAQDGAARLPWMMVGVMLVQLGSLLATCLSQIVETKVLQMHILAELRKRP